MTLVALALTQAWSAGAADAPATARPGERTVRAPAVGLVSTYAPAGPPTQVVLFLSGDGGWNLGVIPMARRLRDEGALVVGIDVRAFMKALDASASCAYPAGVLEEISRSVQATLHLPAYRRPLVVGYSSGATLAYAAIAGAPPETFIGALSLGFCPDLELHTPVCQMRGLRATKRPRGVGYDLAPFAASTVPWMVLQGEQDQVCAPDGTRAFVQATGAARLFSLPKVGHGFGVPARWEPAYLDAYRTLTRQADAAEPSLAQAPAVADLKLVEVPATVTAPPSDVAADTLAVVLTGDGGWAEIDKALAAGLAARGIPVVGWSSLTYYWAPRTPDQAAADLARIVEHYTTDWKRSRVLVVGYSFGADVAPFLVNRLPPATRAHVATLALLAPSNTASFEFHVAGWLGVAAGSPLSTRPEIDRLSVPTACISPADEPEPACRSSNPRVRAVAAPAGHHFGGDYERLVRLIVPDAPEPGDARRGVRDEMRQRSVSRAPTTMSAAPAARRQVSGSPSTSAAR